MNQFHKQGIVSQEIDVEAFPDQPVSIEGSHLKGTLFVKWHFNFMLDPTSRLISKTSRVFRMIDLALFLGQDAQYVRSRSF